MTPALDIYGELQGQTAWHRIPFAEKSRKETMASIRRLPLQEEDVEVLSEVLQTPVKIITHRSMVQLDRDKKYQAAAVLLDSCKSAGVSIEQIKIFLVLLEGDLTKAKEATAIRGGCLTSMKVNDRVRLSPFHNASEVQITDAISKENCSIYPIKLDNLKPGDVLEVQVRLHEKTIDRVAVNFGIKHSA